MKVLLSVSEEAYKELTTNGVVEAQTDWDNPYSIAAYKLLQEKANIDNFFFSFEANKEADYESMVDNMPGRSYHSYILEVNLPENLAKFAMGYYNFSDLIYFFDNASTEELEENGYAIIEAVKAHEMSGKVDPSEVTLGLVQVIFPVIKEDWVESVTPYEKRTTLIDKFSSEK